MTFTPPAFTPYPWQNDPSQATPLDKEHLQADDQAVVAYAQAMIQAYDTYLQTSVNGIPGFDGGASGVAGTRIKWRRDTAANWTANNPTLFQGEVGLETDTGYLKIGDGSTAWSSLTYQKVNSGGLPASVVSASSTPAQAPGLPWAINAKDGTYGATGNGVTDDTVAITAALATGKDVFLPTGTYIVSNLAFNSEHQRIFGQSTSGTILKAKAAAAQVISNTGLRYNTLAYLTVDGNALASKGLYIAATIGATSQDFMCERVLFQNCTKGVHIDNVGVTQADKNTFLACQWVGNTIGLQNDSTNGQETLLINPNLVYNANNQTGIQMGAGTLGVLGGQSQGTGSTGLTTLKFSGTGLGGSTGGLGWVWFQDFIDENVATSIDGSTAWPWDGISLKHTVLQGTTHCVVMSVANTYLSAQHSEFNNATDFNVNATGCTVLTLMCDRHAPTFTGSQTPNKVNFGATGAITTSTEVDAATGTGNRVYMGDLTTLRGGGAGLALSGALDTFVAWVSSKIVQIDSQLQLGKATPTYSSSITPDASKGPWQTITATNGTAFTINAPTNPPSSAYNTQLTIEVLNSAGGALGVISWNGAFVFPTGAWTNPANTKKRFARFEWNGANWICTSLATADY